MRLARTFAVFVPLLLGGCPRSADDPTRSSSAQPCSSDADCVAPGGSICGPVRVCVDQMCEETPSRTRFCR